MAQQSLSLANLQAALTQNNAKMQEWVNSQIGDIDLFSIEWVQTLPTTDISTSTIYMIKNENAEEGENIYTEYVYNSALSAWEVLGELHAEVDLSGYYDKTEVDNLLKSYYKSTEVDTKIADELKSYYTQTQIDTTLADYAKTSEVDTKLADYAKTTEVDTKLEDYYTETEIDTKLADYAKTSEVNTTLEGYYTETEVDTILEDYYKKTDIDTKMQNYYDKTTMDGKLQALEVSGYQEQEITDMISGLWPATE